MVDLLADVRVEAVSDMGWEGKRKVVGVGEWIGPELELSVRFQNAAAAVTCSEVD
jgi:hypothetical protein